MQKADIVDFPLKQAGAETLQRILKAALKWDDLQSVVVIGLDSDDKLMISTTFANNLETMGILDLAKYDILKICSEEE